MCSTLALADPARAASSPATNDILYLLTYDHGGLILWGTDHFAERLRNAISWLERYPSFKLGLDNEAYVYDYLAEHDPALLEELRGYLKKYPGRFGIGSCTYGQPLSQFINDESNIRQIAYALKTDRERLGCVPPIYVMSEHAMHSQVPQLLAGLGFKGAILRTHFMMYGYNPTFDVPIGWWVGLDGSRIPAVPTYPGEGAEFGRTTVDNWFLTRYPGPEVKMSPEDFRRQFARIRPLLATRADDSGLRKEELLKEVNGNPEYRWLLLDELLSVFPKPEAEMKTVPNDFKVRMPWGYCGNEIWNLSRQAEVQVLTAERLAALELLEGGTNRAAELEPAWKNLLVAQHHDIQICGLLPDARRFLSASLRASTNVLNASLQLMAARMKAEGLAQVTVFNPLSWPRREWVEVEVTVPRGVAKDLAVQHAGQVVPSTLLETQRSSSGSIQMARVAFQAELPALAVRAFSIVPVKEALTRANTDPASAGLQAAKVDFDPDSLRISTPFYEVRLNPEGGLASLVDKRSGAALIASDKRNCFFAGRINGQDCESQGKWTVHVPGEGSPWAVAREYGFIGRIPYTLEIRFQADTTRLDCHASFHFESEKIGQVSEDQRDGRSPFVHEHKLRFKLFPATGSDSVGVRDLPFAISETTNRYVEGLYWTALASRQGGVAFFNRGTMGAVRETDGGFSLPLAYSMYYIWGTRMLSGDYAYEFALQPFLGVWSQADLHREALDYNFPLVHATGKTGSGILGPSSQPLQFVGENALLSALYPEKGAVLARAFEFRGQGGNASITVQGRPPHLEQTDLLGSPGQPVSGPVPLQPWQLRTFRIPAGRD